jgi:hypothetical protein
VCYQYQLHKLLGLKLSLDSPLKSDLCLLRVFVLINTLYLSGTAFVNIVLLRYTRAHTHTHTRTHTQNCSWCNSPKRDGVTSFSRFVDHTQLHATVCRTSLDERSASRKDFYLTTIKKKGRHSCPRGMRTRNLCKCAECFTLYCRINNNNNNNNSNNNNIII